MPLPESTQAAALTFDAAVHRALSRRRSDTPWPHNGAPSPDSRPPAPEASTGEPPAPAGGPAPRSDD